MIDRDLLAEIGRLVIHLGTLDEWLTLALAAITPHSDEGYEKLYIGIQKQPFTDKVTDLRVELTNVAETHQLTDSETFKDLMARCDEMVSSAKHRNDIIHGYVQDDEEATGNAVFFNQRFGRKRGADKVVPPELFWGFVPQFEAPGPRPPLRNPSSPQLSIRPFEEFVPITRNH